MIRYNLIVAEPSKTYDLKLSLTSTNLNVADQYEIQKFFVSNIGDNFPCVSLSNQLIVSITNRYIINKTMHIICNKRKYNI
jgi:hypothetical protein